MNNRSFLKKINDFTWEISRSFQKEMKVPAIIYASEKMINDISYDKSFNQLTNIASLPSVYGNAFAMPDVHQGYGSPIGGVAAFDLSEGGIISPSICGFDINCGVRVLTTNVKVDDVSNFIKKITEKIFENVPSGLGQGQSRKYGYSEIDNIFKKGPLYLAEKGIGTKDDVEKCEEKGCLSDADFNYVSQRAKKRGANQIGTLGSGNHFIEVQKVVKIFNLEVAKTFKLKEGQLIFMIHSGSRGVGHQVASDYIKLALDWANKNKIILKDKELAYVPFESVIGNRYWGAMASAANFAWSNRHFIGHIIRNSCKDVLGRNIQVETLYDVAHNIVKKEKYDNKNLLVHRKGATRAFWKDHLDVIKAYRNVGQPVLIPGSMGTSSWILVGNKDSESKSFGSTCHGAGRVMSRSQAKKEIKGSKLKNNLQKKGIEVYSKSMANIAEESPKAYKNIDDVISVVDSIGLAKKVAQLKPLSVIK